MKLDLNKRYQTLLTLWFALLASVGLYFVFIMIAAPEFNNASGHAEFPLDLDAFPPGRVSRTSLLSGEAQDSRSRS